MIKLQHFKSIIASVSLLGAMLFCGTPVAAAHGLSSIVVDVPFDFIVNGKTLPAGKYHVHRALVDADTVLYIHKVGSGEGTSFTTNAAIGLSTPNKTALIFHHYGSAHYLAEIWTGSNNIGHPLPVSKAEQAAARVARTAQSKGTSTAETGKVSVPAKSS